VTSYNPPWASSPERISYATLCDLLFLLFAMVNVPRAHLVCISPLVMPPSVIYCSYCLQWLMCLGVLLLMFVGSFIRLSNRCRSQGTSSYAGAGVCCAAGQYAPPGSSSCSTCPSGKRVCVARHQSAFIFITIWCTSSRHDVVRFRETVDCARICFRLFVTGIRICTKSIGSAG
jgi:hypothetical protein